MTRLDRRTLLAVALGGVAAGTLGGCQRGGRDASVGVGPGSPAASVPPSSGRASASPVATATRPATSRQIAARATVPMLWWHQLRDWKVPTAAMPDS